MLGFFRGIWQGIIDIDYNKWIPLIVGTFISVISAWYSIVGLTAIFSGSPIAIRLMGAGLEAGKVVTASYLYRNWKKTNLGLRIYFTGAVIALMLITSMGTFGYLSKAHITNMADMPKLEEQIKRLNEKISGYQVRIDRNNKEIKQYNSAIDSIIDQGYVTRGIGKKDELQPKIDALQKDVDSWTELQETLKDQRSTKQDKISDLQNELGPVKYVAELIFQRDDVAIMEYSIRWMIVLLVFVLDPLAVALIMIGTNNKRKPKKITVANATKNFNNMKAEIGT